MAATYFIIGQPGSARVDGTCRLTGATPYTDDLFLLRMLYGEILCSPLPHARMLFVDTGKAVALPGIFAVITGAALPQPSSFKTIVDGSGHSSYGVASVLYTRTPQTVTTRARITAVVQSSSSVGRSILVRDWTRCWCSSLLQN